MGNTTRESGPGLFTGLMSCYRQRQSVSALRVFMFEDSLLPTLAAGVLAAIEWLEKNPEDQMSGSQRDLRILRFAILRRMPKKSRAGHSTTVGLVQMSCEQKPETNLKSDRRPNEAAKRGAQIVCLQRALPFPIFLPN